MDNILNQQTILFFYKLVLPLFLPFSAPPASFLLIFSVQPAFLLSLLILPFLFHPIQKLSSLLLFLLFFFLQYFLLYSFLYFFLLRFLSLLPSFFDCFLLSDFPSLRLPFLCYFLFLVPLFWLFSSLLLSWLSL